MNTDNVPVINTTDAPGFIIAMSQQGIIIGNKIPYTDASGNRSLYPQGVRIKDPITMVVQQQQSRVGPPSVAIQLIPPFIPCDVMEICNPTFVIQALDMEPRFLADLYKNYMAILATKRSGIVIAGVGNA